MMRFGAFQKSALQSLGAHVALALWLMARPFEGVSAPKGVSLQGGASAMEVSILRSGSAAKRTAVKSRHAIAASKKSKREETTDTPTEKATGLGTAEGQAQSGRLGVANGAEVSARERYLYELRRWIEANQIYPALSKRFHETGVVTVKFEVSRDGHIHGVGIDRPCQHERLNHASVTLLSRLGKFRNFPPELQIDKLDIVLPIEYVLQ